MLRPSAGLAMAVALAIGVITSGAASAPLQQPEEVGNAACAPCHKAISDSYATTAMARTSGPALPNLIEGSFRHPPSGVSYRLFRENGRALLSYDRPPDLHGRQPLAYSVGSNTRGRTFLFAIDGFLYQSPINYFAAKRVWDMSPGYAELREMELNHPVDATCLFCHASRVQPRVKGTMNRFAGDPFLQAGVGCERCHGPGSAHAAGRGSLVNPGKLQGQRRDDVCMQCHLEGVARIATAGHTPFGYRPGEPLSGSLAIFVRPDAARTELGAVSQFEALAISACKRASGDALTCITCHDPHVQVTAAKKATHYRAKCLGCHQTMAADHHPEQPDCTSCHMPRLDSADVSHTEVTDHRIVRFAGLKGSIATAGETLTQFGNATPDPRDLGLAYGELALRGNTFAANESFRLLNQAIASHPDDADVLTRLGYFYQVQGDADRAQRLYERALEHDPDLAVVAGNLGVIYAARGKLMEALALWRNAFEKNPQLTELALNLGTGLCHAGDGPGARQVVRRALEHNPDSAAARQLLSSITDAACVRRE